MAEAKWYVAPVSYTHLDAFVKQIDITNSQMVLQYGASSQKKIADFSESALGNVRTKDLGEMCIRDRDYILHKGLVMIGCAGLALVLGICSARFCALCGQGFGANLREAEYRKLQSYSFSNIDHFQVSSLVTRLTSDVTVIQNSVSTGIRPLCRAPVMLFMATGSAFVINARLALVFLVALPVLGFLLFEIVSHVGPLYTKMQTGIDRVNRIVQENLTADVYKRQAQKLCPCQQDRRHVRPCNQAGCGADGMAVCKRGQNPHCRHGRHPDRLSLIHI